MLIDIKLFKILTTLIVLFIDVLYGISIIISFKERKYAYTCIYIFIILYTIYNWYGILIL